MREHLFGPDPAASVSIAEVDGAVAGMALWFRTFSTFLGEPGIWLEDLFVRPDHRGSGVGAALLHHLRSLTAGRVEWSVLDWNREAIEFYERLGARPDEAAGSCTAGRRRDGGADRPAPDPPDGASPPTVLRTTRPRACGRWSPAARSACRAGAGARRGAAGEVRRPPAARRRTAHLPARPASRPAPSSAAPWRSGCSCSSCRCCCSSSACSGSSPTSSTDVDPDDVGITGGLAGQINSALTQPNSTRWIAVLVGFVGMATTGRSLSKGMVVGELPRLAPAGAGRRRRSG